MEETFIDGGAGKLFTRVWRPAERPRGVVVVVHGFMAHSGLYAWVAEALVKRDLAVYALDLRGHGKSDGEHYYAESIADYVDDLKRLVTVAKARDAGLPIYMLGHSAGGVVACTYALDYQDNLAGLICESFAHEVPAPDFALAVIKGLSHVAPHVHVLRLKEADFSRDPKVVEAMRNDPLIHHIAYPTKTVAALVRADERLRKEFPKIKLPVLILHGTADRAAKPSGSQHFFEKTGSIDKTLKLYDGYYHDLLNDTGKEVVLADIVEWIITRLPTRY
jgi:acylglycerol lipase